MLEMPDAAPTCSSSTAAVAIDEEGPLDRPRPIAIASRAGRNVRYDHDGRTSASSTNPAVSRMNPTTMTGRAPNLLASGVTAGATRTTTTATGNVASPACRLLIPKVAGSWKYRLIRNETPAIAPAPIRMAAVDPTSSGLRSSARSTRGAATRRSTSTNPTPASTATARQTRVAG